MITGVKAVSFDAGGTLFEPWPSVGEVYASVAREFGVDCRAEQVTERFVSAWRRRSGFGYTRAEWFELVCQSFRDAAEVSPELFDAIYRRFAQAEAWKIFEDVLPALEGLRAAGLRLIVVSNWDERLRPLLETLDLSRFFEEICVSTEVGVHKPDARLFDHAAKRLGLCAAEILHVGDSEREDVQSARAARWHAARIRRSGATEPVDIESLSAIAQKVLF